MQFINQDTPSYLILILNSIAPAVLFALMHSFSKLYSRMPRHSCCEVRVMQLHDIFLLRTSAILPEAISAGGLTPATDTSLFLTTYRGGSHLPADIIIVANNTTIINDKSSNPTFWQILTDQESASFLDCLFSRDELATESATKALHPCFP